MNAERLPKLRHVKFTQSKGQLYAYFNLGISKGRRRYAPLPRYGSEEFFDAYAGLLAAREEPSRLTFKPDELAAHADRARTLANGTAEQESARVVYFVQCATGEIKIGVAFNLYSRLKSLQAAHPRPVKLLAETRGGIPVERAYHERFAAHRVQGEWFEPQPDILAEIERLNAENKSGQFKPNRKPALKPA
jgi:hypothetical protein